MVFMLLAQLFVAPVLFADADFRFQEFRIPYKPAGTKGLEAALALPQGKGPFPLVILSHGSPRSAEDRPHMKATGNSLGAHEFLKRGWAVVVVLRRGYGTSGGNWAETYGTCKKPDYEKAGRASADDLRATIDYMIKQKNINAQRILAVGISAGGFATVALTANPPKGLIAAVNLAGGRGSSYADTVCEEEKLVQAFAAYGKTSRVPMLWVYAQNDHFFGPQLAQKLFAAFKAKGGKAIFHATEAFGNDGHALLSAKGIQMWSDQFDAFIKDK